MSQFGRPASLVGGILAILLGGLLFVACQSAVSPAGSSTTGASPTAGFSSSTTGGFPTTGGSTSIGSSTTTAADVSLGKTVYVSGTDASGKPIPRTTVTGMTGPLLACADCHGSDARGRTIQMMMGQVQAPDIRWSTLTATPTDSGDKAFDADSFFLALTQGLDPNGSSLKVYMPRWQLTRDETDALIDYLKTL